MALRAFKDKFEFIREGSRQENFRNKNKYFISSKKNNNRKLKRRFFFCKKFR